MINQEIKSIFLTKSESEKYNNKLNIYSNECGCNVGTYFLLISLILCFIFSVTKFSIFSTTIYYQVLFSGIAIIFASLSGKIIGLFIAKLKFVNTIRQMNKLIKKRELENTLV